MTVLVAVIHDLFLVLKKPNHSPLQSATARPGSCEVLMEKEWWGKQDSNLRRRSQRIYSPPPLPLGTFPHTCRTPAYKSDAGHESRSHHVRRFMVADPIGVNLKKRKDKRSF